MFSTFPAKGDLVIQFWLIRPNQKAAKLAVGWTWGFWKLLFSPALNTPWWLVWWQPSCHHVKGGICPAIVEWLHQNQQPPTSCYIRKINFCWFIVTWVRFSVSCTKHIPNWHRGGWSKRLPKWLGFTRVWELKAHSEDNLIRCLEPTGSAPAPVENRKELPNLITKGIEQPSSEASKLIVCLNLIHRQSQGNKMKPVMDAATSAVSLLWF